MDIDTDTLGIPDTEYDVCVAMPSAEFARIVRDLSALGESVKIDVSKDGVRFSAEGEAANGNILLKQSENARRKSKHVGKAEGKGKKSKVKKEGGDEDKDEEEPESEEEGESSKKKKKTKVKREEGGSDVEMVEDDDNDDDDGEAKPDEDVDEDTDSESNSKKRKKAPSKVRLCPWSSVPIQFAHFRFQSSKPSKRAKRSDDDDDEYEGGVSIDMNQAVTLTFSLKYLVNFSKSTSLSRQVQLMMSADVPLLVSQ